MYNQTPVNPFYQNQTIPPVNSNNNTPTFSPSNPFAFSSSNPFANQQAPQKPPLHPSGSFSSTPTYTSTTPSYSSTPQYLTPDNPFATIPTSQPSQHPQHNYNTYQPPPQHSPVPLPQHQSYHNSLIVPPDSGNYGIVSQNYGQNSFNVESNSLVVVNAESSYSSQPAPPIPHRNFQVLSAPLPQRPKSSELKNPALSDPGDDVIKRSRKGMISVYATLNFVIICDNSKPEEDPLVIEKKNGHPGNFVPYSAVLHGTDKEKSSTAYIEGEMIMGIFILSPAESCLIVVTGKEPVASIGTHEIFKIIRVRFLSFKERSIWVPVGEKPQKAPYASVEKFILSGLFYYSLTYPLTHSLQRQTEMAEDIQSKSVWKIADKRFFWNHYLMRHFIQQRLDKWVVPIIRGFVGIDKNISIPDRKESIDLIIISRSCCLKAGTRYNTRGINDDGNVANYAESEQIFSFDNKITSFVTIRGSVPAFWQQRFIKGSFKVELTRTLDATVPAFTKHLDEQLKLYKRIHIVNLLENKKTSEGLVSGMYEDLIRKYKGITKDNLSYTYWDFHKECGNSKFENVTKLIYQVKSDIEDNFSYFMQDIKTKTVLKSQNGVFRINCLDCLDRTNVIMGAINQHSFISQMRGHGVSINRIPESSRLGTVFKTLWANNGDNISIAYAGTGAMKSSFTRTGKRSIAGMVDDATKSAKRVYINISKDNVKQKAIDLFLGNIEEQVDEELRSDEDIWVAKQLHHHHKLYGDVKPYKFYICTWNTNATVPDQKLPLDELICPENRRDFDHDSISVYIFGFQEIVELTANAIVKADETNMDKWSNLLQNAINMKRRHSKILLANKIQLVGLAIIVFIQQDYAGDIRNFTIEKTKTAVSGFTGNKGALSCRFDFKDTAICCVCAHLTAGQNKNPDRVKDISGILTWTRFPNTHKYSKIGYHDYILWFGDLNFRIDMPYQDVINKVFQNDLDTLLGFDQLNKVRQINTELLANFHEGKINFKPTYKYDLSTDTYDTSEKKRTPAWCDRILYRASDELNVKQEFYNRGELYTSDHRPVKTLLVLDIRIVDHKIKDKLKTVLHKLYKTLEKTVLESTLEVAYDIDPNFLKFNDSSELLAIDLAKDSNQATPSLYLEMAPPPPDPYSELEEAPTPPTPTHNPIQQTVHLYRANFSSMKATMLQSFGNSEKVMFTTNQICGTSKELLDVLKQLPNNESAIRLTTTIYEQVKQIGNVARAYIGQLNDANLFSSMIAVIDMIILLIDQYVPYLN